MTPAEVLKAIYDAGCPTYRSNDGSRTRNGAACCHYCDEVIESNGEHAAGCLWLEIEHREFDRLVTRLEQITDSPPIKIIDVGD